MFIEWSCRTNELLKMNTIILCTTVIISSNRTTKDLTSLLVTGKYELHSSRSLNYVKIPF